jgi:hypothetical protein
MLDARVPADRISEHKLDGFRWASMSTERRLLSRGAGFMNRCDALHMKELVETTWWLCGLAHCICSN